MLLYNEDFISTFKISEYESALNDPTYLDKIKNSYNNRYSNDNRIKTEVRDILFKESLDHYILKELINNPTFIDSQQMHNYMNFFIGLYNANSIEFNTNIVFINDNIREKLVDKFLSKFKKQLDTRSTHDNDECDKIIEKINKGENVTQLELNYACEYIARLRYPQSKENVTLLKFIFGNMKNTNLKFSYQVQDLVLSYLPYFYTDGNVLNVRYALGDTDNNRTIVGPGHSSGTSNYVALSKKVFENVNLNSIEDSNVERLKQGNDITFFMIVALHEITHQLQNARTKWTIYDNQGMGEIIKNILNREYHDYKVNHDSDEIEIEANQRGWEKSAEFYYHFYTGPNRDKLLSNCTANKHTSNFRRIFSLKKDKNDNYVLYSDYDIEKLVEILKSKPNYIEEYPMLKHFFNEKGVIQLSYMFKESLWSESTGNEFINYFYNHKGINAMMSFLDKKRISEREITRLIDNLYYFIDNNLNVDRRFMYIFQHNSYGQYKNNPDFNEDIINNLSLEHYKKTLHNYKCVLPLFEKIENVYPKSASYIRQAIFYIEEKINKSTNNKDWIESSVLNSQISPENEPGPQKK